jgi:hypothetical protein
MPESDADPYMKDEKHTWTLSASFACLSLSIFSGVMK